MHPDLCDCDACLNRGPAPKRPERIAYPGIRYEGYRVVKYVLAPPDTVKL